MQTGNLSILLWIYYLFTNYWAVIVVIVFFFFFLLIGAKKLQATDQKKPNPSKGLNSDDAEVLAMWREAMKGKAGRPKKGCESQPIKTDKGSGVHSYTVSRLQREVPELFAQVAAAFHLTDSAGAWSRPNPTFRAKTTRHTKPHRLPFTSENIGDGLQP